MKYTLKHNVKIGPREVDLLEGLTDTPCKKWLLMFFGTGGLGPTDGSQINDMYSGGYQKYPLFETEFNILAPQANKSYNEFDPYIEQWMKDTYGQDIEIVLTGHSLGSRNVMEYVNGYNGVKAGGNVVGAVAIAGEMSYPLPVDPCTCVDIPVFAFHGDQDGPTPEFPRRCCISPVQSAKFVNLLNSCPTRKNKAVLRIIPGADHGSIMKYVFEPSRDAEGYKTIMSCFAPEALEIPGRLVLRDGKPFAIFENGTEQQLSTV